MKPWVYVAGPYSGDVIANVRGACQVGELIRADGIFTPVVPHLTMIWDVFCPADYEVWLAYDLELLAKCQALFRMPSESPGADREVQWALENYIPVFTELLKLYEWQETRWAT